MEKQENTIDIKNFLPHRAPMLMVDFIYELSDQNVKTIFEIKENNIFVENGYFTEVGLIENAAQTCSSIVGQSFFLDENHEVKKDVEVIGFISGIKRAKIYSQPKLGNTIQTDAVLASRFDADGYSICTMNCQTYNKEVLIFEAEINLFIQEKK
ncbi:MAG: ABC transporter permease [Flavobacterium sp.]|jgi:3-hydroxymyristoyl/3-hydroxydecanoyl-(acyl carrier protein) dehydratase